MLTPLLAAGVDKPGLAVIRSSHQETIHDNLGTVNVVVSLQGMELSAGHHYLCRSDARHAAEQDTATAIGHLQCPGAKLWRESPGDL